MNAETLEVQRLPGPNTGTKQEALDYASVDPRIGAMLALAAEHQWPEAYQDDLYHHDVNCLRAHPGVDLIWILRDHGTHVILLDPEDDPRAARRCAIPLIEFHSGDHRLNCYGDGDRRPKYFYIFASGQAVESNADEAKQVVYETFR